MALLRDGIVFASIAFGYPPNTLVRGCTPNTLRERRIKMKHKQRGFIVRLSPKEFEILDERANKCGLTRNAYIRKVICEVQPVERPSADLISVIRELRFIGKNMNQIAMRANETNMVDALQYNKNFDMVHKAISKLIMGDYKWQ